MYNTEDEDNSTGMRHERYHIPESKTRRTIQTIMGIVMVIIYCLLYTSPSPTRH